MNELTELRSMLGDIRVVRDNPQDGLDGWADQVWPALDWLENHAEVIEVGLRVVSSLTRCRALHLQHDGPEHKAIMYWDAKHTTRTGLGWGVLDALRALDAPESEGV